MQHRSVRGAIRYISRKPENDGALRGFERFHFTHHGDGSVVMRATCELEYPEPKVLRDVVVGYDPAGEVTDGHVRVMVDDKLMATALYWTDDQGGIEMEGWSPQRGRTSERRPYSRAGFETLGSHPVIGDGYAFRELDVSRGPHRRRLKVMMVSPDHRGASPPALSPADIPVEYVGDETVTVAAGTFDTHHFRYLDDGASGLDGTHPPLDVWVTADGDYVYIKGKIGGYFNSEYELVEYDVVAGS